MPESALGLALGHVGRGRRAGDGHRYEVVGHRVLLVVAERLGAVVAGGQPVRTDRQQPGHGEECQEREQHRGPGGPLGRPAPEHPDPKNGGEQDGKLPGDLELLEDVLVLQGNEHAADDDQHAEDPAQQDGNPLAGLGVDVGDVEVAHDQGGDDQHVAACRAHQRGHQAGEHQPDQAGVEAQVLRREDFSGGHAPGAAGVLGDFDVVGHQGQHDQDRDAPADRAEPLEEVAGHQAHARGVLRLGRSASGGRHVRVDHDGHQVQQRDGEDVVEWELAAAGRLDDLEVLLGHLLVHDPEPVHHRQVVGIAELLVQRRLRPGPLRVGQILLLEGLLGSRLVVARLVDQGLQAGRDQQHRQQDNEDALDQVGPIGRPQPAQHAVDQHHRRAHVDQDLFGRHREVDPSHADPDDVDADQRGTDLADGVEAQPEVDRVEGDRKQHECEPQALALVAFGEPIAKRDVAHAAIPDGGDPIEGCDEQPQQHAPDPAQPAGIGRPTHGHGVLRARARSEGRERLEQSPERPAPEEEVFLLLDRQHREDADKRHQDEVAHQDDIVQRGHCRTPHTRGLAGQRPGRVVCGFASGRTRRAALRRTDWQSVPDSPA